MDLSKTNKYEFELGITFCFLQEKKDYFFLRLEAQCPWWEDCTTGQ